MLNTHHEAIISRLVYLRIKRLNGRELAAARKTLRVIPRSCPPPSYNRSIVPAFVPGSRNPLRFSPPGRVRSPGDRDFER